MKPCNWSCYAIMFMVLITGGEVLAYNDGPTTSYGSYDAEVVRIIDGDTIVVVANIWPRMSTYVHVRLRGIDTPEYRGAAICEKQLSKQATAYVTTLVSVGDWVTLKDVTLGKYAGRVVGNLVVRGKDLSTYMIKKGYAVPYNGGKKTKVWC